MTDAVDPRRLIATLHRALRDTHGGSSLVERFDELTKLLYCKAHDERADAAFRHDGDDAAVADRVRRRFDALAAARPSLFPPRFRHLTLGDAALAHVSRALADVSLGASDVVGVAYEELIRNTLDKGDHQQFFTPTPIVEFAVALVRDALGAAPAGRVCDPACGTGGFLLAAARAIPGVVPIGLEVDERLAWAAGVNLDLHGVDAFDVRHLLGAGSLGSDVPSTFAPVDVVLTNPPFGSDLTDAEALDALALGRGRGTRRRGVLFVERCLELVRPGGLVAIVIDDGVLNLPTNSDVRRLILRSADVLAIVSLPDGAFLPYAAVKSSVLLLRRRTHDDAPSPPTFFAEAAEIGRKPNGDPLYRVDAASRRLVLDSDFPALLAAWRRGPDSAGEGSSDAAFWTVLPDDPAFAADGWRLDLAYHHPARRQAAAALTASRWPLVPLRALCDVRNETAIPSEAFGHERITWIGLAEIAPRTGEVVPSIVDASSLRSVAKRCIAGDVLFARLRPALRKAACVPDAVSDGWVSAECIVLVPRRGDDGAPSVLPELLALLLRSDVTYGQLVHVMVGIGRPRVNQRAIMEIRLPVPPLDEQRRLVEAHHEAERRAAELRADAERSARAAEDVLADADRALVDGLL